MENNEKLWNEIIISHLFWYFSMFFFKKCQCFFYLFQIMKIIFWSFFCFFLNLTVILSILTAFLRLIRVEASHEAYVNNLWNTFMTTIAFQSYAHELGHISVTFDSRVHGEWHSCLNYGWKNEFWQHDFLCLLRFIIRTDEHTHIHTRMHARTDTYHSPPVYQRSLIYNQVHDHVRKIEIARYCRHEGIPWVVYRSLMRRKNAVRIDRITVKFRKKTSKKKKIIWKKSKKRWEIEKCYITKENVKQKSLFCWTFIELNLNFILSLKIYIDSLTFLNAINFYFKVFTMFWKILVYLSL